MAIRLEKTIWQPTYLEIAGKAHKEDVITNILAFFFQPNYPHGLGGLFLNTFLKCLGDTETLEPGNFDTVEVLREVYTGKGNRIDLVIECDSLALVIENKINHWLANDLVDYRDHCTWHFRDKRVLFAILSMDKQSGSLHGFTNVTYKTFLNSLAESISVSGIQASGTYQYLLDDFFCTLNRLRPSHMVNEDMRLFFLEHQKTLDELFKEKSLLTREVEGRANKLLKLTTTVSNVKKFVWQGFAVVNERKYPNGLILKADCLVTIRGFHFHVFVQRGPGDNTTANVLEAVPYFKDGVKWDVWLPELPFETPLEIVAEKLNEYVTTVFR